MRLLEDPSTSSALRLALEDDPEDLPTAEAIRSLAETIHLRLGTPNPVRLSARVDTPQALRLALLADSSPEPGALRDVWHGIRRAVNSESDPCQSSRHIVAKVTSEGRGGSIASIARRGRQAVLVAAGIVMFSTLAAAGFKWFGGRPSQPSAHSFSVPPAQGAKALSSRRPAGAKPSTATAEPSIRDASNADPGSPAHPAEALSSARVVSKVPSLRSTPGPSLPRQQGAVAVSTVNSVIAESNLLRQAWAALREGRADVALRVAREHAIQFPAGALAQEREVVEIQALERVGRVSEARQRATSFERRFPDSPHRPLVDAGLSEP
jgi:hypothetical protein